MQDAADATGEGRVESSDIDGHRIAHGIHSPEYTHVQQEVSITVPISRTIQDYREAYGYLRWRSWGWPVRVLLYVVVSGVLVITKGASELWFVGLLRAVLVGSYAIGLFGIASKMQKAHLKNGSTSYTFDGEGFNIEVTSLSRGPRGAP